MATIGKTRQEPGELEVVSSPEVGPARGVLKRPLAAGKMRHSRRSPSPDLARWIAHYWSVSWDLRGCDPFRAETLPHPNIHLTFEAGVAEVQGVHTRRFSRLLEGQGQVFGIKFRAAAFRPFLGGPVSKIANRALPAAQVFRTGLAALEAGVLLPSEEERVEAANSFLRGAAPQFDPAIETANGLVDLILRDVEIRTVDELVRRSGVGKRTLQRMFSEYVGVSPKWVIQRYRLHELIERINAGGKLDWARVAAELGYFDQAHLINDFRTTFGYTPTQSPGQL